MDMVSIEEKYYGSSDLSIFVICLAALAMVALALTWVGTIHHAIS